MLLKTVAGQDNKLPDSLKLIEGDFRLVSEVIPDDSIDLIFTDPPKKILTYSPILDS